MTIRPIETRQNAGKTVGTKLVFKHVAFTDDAAKTKLAAILSQHGLDDVRSI
jgi:adenine-specific DNA-methyltransferase